MSPIKNKAESLQLFKGFIALLAHKDAIVTVWQIVFTY
jgi:hypothetical protein